MKESISPRKSPKAEYIPETHARKGLKKVRWDVERPQNSDEDDLERAEDIEFTDSKASGFKSPNAKTSSIVVINSKKSLDSSIKKPENSRSSYSSNSKSGSRKNYNYEVPNELGYSPRPIKAYGRSSDYLKPQTREVIIEETTVNQGKRDARSVSSNRNKNKFEETPEKKARATSLDFSKRSDSDVDYSFAPYYTKW